MSRVNIQNLQINFGAVAAINGLNLDIRPGEFVVLLGPSGCGKSTLLNSIAGLQDVTSGQISIGEHDMTRVEPKDRGISMVFQAYALYPRMSVRGNLSFGLRAAGVDKAEINRRVSQVAELLQITPLLDRKPVALSGGQRQRVAIGRAIVRDSDVFLFDEPLSNLDAQLRAELRVEIKRLHRRLKSTMIYVTHDQVEAMTLADRIVVMKGGEIQQIGTPAEVFDHPANDFVAKFIGSPAINFLDVRPDGAGQARCGSDQVAVSPDDAALWRASSNARLGIRPEHIEISRDGDGLAAQIDIVEPLGSEDLIWLRADQGEICARVRAGSNWSAGETVRLHFAAEKVHLFDANNGKRI